LNQLQTRWTKSSLARSFQALTNGDRRKLLAVTILQVFMGGLDLLGVVAVGLLGALSVTGLQSNQPGDRIDSVLRFLKLSDQTFQTQAIVIGSAAVFLLVGRTMLSIFFTRRVLYFLSRRGAQLSSRLVSHLLSQPLLVVQARSTQETLFAVTSGVVVIMLQILATSVVLVADVSLLLIMAVGLFVVDPITSIGTFSVFCLIGFFLYRIMHVRAESLGRRSSELNIKSNEKIVEVFASYRESTVRNRRDYYSREIGKLRFNLADTTAELNFMPYISKYIIETTIVIGALLIGAIQFVIADVSHAVATIAIFIAAGTRIAPAVLRIQQGSILIRGAAGQAKPTLDLMESLGDPPLTTRVDDKVDTKHEGFISEVSISNTSLTYPNKIHKAVSDVTLEIPAGASVALVGPSGAGKTTMIDVLLGVLNPDEGSVLISGLPPLFAVNKWPGAVSYVPQDVLIVAGTIRENVALGYPPEEATDELVMSALRVADLDDFVARLPQGIDTQVGERGAQISGGQRQRLGIARAMFTRPLLLVLDEATSSLDSKTEASISQSIQELRGTTTVVMIAHRLSTIRNADIVVYMNSGKVLATGSFEEVRAAVPDFDNQAKLMGL
jgi:ABC-type multidrug transport system fused ATPase/permease subunit